MKENEKKLTDYQQKEIDGIHWEAAFAEKAEAELRANEKAQEFLKKFNPSSVQSFIPHYISHKTMWHKFGEFHLGQQSGHDLKWVEAANEHLKIILQKKLFDLQCLWRAEKITLPGIEICYDFDIWGHDIFNCPFLDPITEEEVELYQEYLQHDDTIALDDNIIINYCNWQAYDNIKEAAETEEPDWEVPEWYIFHNDRLGTGSYLLLPNTRGEKEEFYRDLSRKERKAEIKKTAEADNTPTTAKPPVSNQSYISYYKETDTEDFVNKFEDKLTRQYYKAFKWFDNNSSDAEEYVEMMDELLKADEMIPMEANTDWREGLRKTLIRYRAGKICDALPEALKQYLMTRSMNIGFPHNGNMSREVRYCFLDPILAGRKLNGEPEDLNF